MVNLIMQALQIINENDLAVYGFEQSSFGFRAKGRGKVRGTGQGQSQGKGGMSGRGLRSG
jgi:hypothetical protein